MVEHQVTSSGTCKTCETETNEEEVLQCYDCQSFYHGVCNKVTPFFASKSFISSFKKLKSKNFTFVCNQCITRRENNQASSLNDQISELADTVKMLAEEFKSFKEEKKVIDGSENDESKSHGSWSNPQRLQKMKSSLCIKSKGTPVNISKVQEIATNNNIQVTKSVVKDNGDVYLDMPTQENRERLTPLLDDPEFESNEIVTLKSKLPTISILNVDDYETKEDFIEKVKKQNPNIKSRIEAGSEFSVVYCVKPKNESQDAKYQVVVRVSDDVRRAIKLENDRIYFDLTAKKVVDRFYIKRCNKCQSFGHYERDCEERVVCCGYCRKDHKSTDCQEVQAGDFKNYECVNCHKNGKECKGHSSIWHKCPMYLDLQNKLKKSIPFYNTKN